MSNINNDAHTCEAPTVSLLGVGGCGVNLVRTIYSKVGKLVNFANFLDCSDANQYDNETVYIVANKFGGGKLRETNLNEIRARIPQLTEEIVGDSDVYILVGSLAGATGGVMIPLLVKELHSRGKKVIVGLISEAIDEKGTDNTLSSLKALVTLTDKFDIYLPTTITHTDRNRKEADAYMVKQISAIIGVLRLPCYEIDKNDRLNFLDASKTLGKEAGIHMIYGITEGFDTSNHEDLQDHHMIADSALHLGVKDEEGNRIYVDPVVDHARFAKDGILAEGKTPVAGVIVDGTKALETIIGEIEKKKHLFSNPVQSPSKALKAKLLGDDDIDQFI